VAGGAGGAGPGWYPDYEAPEGHERYWDGERWTLRRSAPEPSSAAPELRSSRLGVLVIAGGLLLLALVVALVVTGGEDEPDRGAVAPASDSAPATSAAPPAGSSSEVTAVVDGLTLELADGEQVRLDGLASSCSTGALAALVQGREVSLVQRGADRDDEGRLLRYVERDGLDVGLRLIQKGFARASDEPNARGAIYRRVDARSADRC
jgi:hypothetical protein